MKKLDFLPNLRNRYSIRRFTVGTASILIGSLLFLGHNGEAKAAESTNDNTVVEASKDTSTSQQEPVENTVPQDKTTDTIQQAGNTQTTSNVLETVKTDALSKLSTFTHLTEETVKQYTAEVKQAQTEADVQAVVDKAQKAEAEAVKQAEAEQTKTVDSTKEQSAATTEVPKSTTESVKEETKADTTSATTSETNNTSEAKTVTSTDQATPTIESTPLSTEQKVDKVKTELASDYDSSKVDAALAVIDTTDLTEDQIKAEVLKLLLEQGSAQKDLYSPQATKLRSAVEEPTTAVRTFSVDTSLKNEVVVTPENFNQYFFLVDDAYYDPSSGTATLTQNWPSQKGSISLDTKMNVNKDFHFSGWINLGDKYEGHPKVGAPGGDGIAFIFNPGNTHELGLYGSALGVGGLKYAFGFKLDTYVNTQYDPKGKAKPDPAQFNKVGAFGAFVFADSTGVVSTQPGLTGWKAALLDVQPENNQFQRFTIDYSGDTKDMTITYAGQTWKQNMNNYFKYTHKNEYALSIAATTGGAYNLQQVKLEQFTYTAGALLEEDFVDTDLQELIDRPLRTSGDVDNIITVQDHNAYLAEKGYKFVSEDTSYAPTYDAAKKTIKLTNASQFLVYYVKDIEAPKIGDIVAPTVDVNTAMTPLVLDITDNSKHLKTKTVTGLPAGVTFDEATNTISGTPTAVGTSTITVTATDHAGLSTTKTFTYTVVDTKAPDVTMVVEQTTEAYTPMTPINVNAEDNSKVAPTLAVTGLPTGLSFDPTTKQITGTPTTVGTSTVTVSATDGSTNVGTSTFNIVVTPNKALEALKAAVADAKTVNKNDYTPNSVAALDAKLTEAEALIAHPENGSTDQFNAKTQEVKQAKDQLVRKADKTDLEKAIAEASKYTNLDPTKPMDQQLITALANAKNTDTDQNATQKAVDDSKNSLNNAIQEKLRADAYEKLQQAVMRGVQVAKTDGYTPNSLQAVKDTIQKVNPLVTASMSDDPTVRKQYTVDQIEQATKDINDSISGLVRQADKTELEKAIAKAGTLGQLNAADTEDKAVQDALAKANQVKADGNATPQQVAEATDTLNKAIDKKLYQDALDELNAAIRDAEAVTKANYTPETVTPFEKAVTDGKAKAADSNATPEQLKAVAQAIKTAKDALKQKANKAELEKSIATAEALQPLKAGDPEDDAVKAALDKAKQVDANQNADQASVDAAKVELDNAIKAKQTQDAADALKQAALDELKAELAKVAKIDKNNFTPDSVTPLAEKETAGNAIVANPENKTVDEIKTATQALKDAEKGLQAKSDKAALQAAIDKAEALTGLNPADAEDKAVQDALAAAKKVNDNPNASQAEVQAATKTLNDAVAAKEHADALDALKAELAKVAGINKDQYTPNSVAPLNTKEADGKAIVAAPEAKTTEEIKAATQALKEAEAGLVDRADKTALQTAIEKAEALPNLDAADKEDKAVQDALTAAKAVDANQNADQAAVDAAKEALDNAINVKKAQDAKEAKEAADAKQAALDELKAELAKVAKIDKNNFTPDTVSPLTEKEDAGKAIVAAPDTKTTEDIKAATQALKDAQNNLVQKADKAELQKAIDKAKTLGQLDPADKEDKALQDAVTAGEAVKADGNATPQQVAEATKAINDAIAAKERQDALDELQKALDAANAVKKDDYKPSTVTPFEAAVQAGEAAKADTSKTPQELKDAAKAIKDAQDALQAKANKAELEKSIATAEGLGQLDANDPEDKAVQDALTAAKAVEADQNADQAAVDAAKKALDDAINAKKAQDAKEAKEAADAKQAALEALKAELEKAKAVQKDNFTPDSVKPLTDAETSGQAIVDAPDGKTTKEIEAATQALKDAQKDLVQKADKAELQKAIDKATGLGQLNPADKEDKAVQDALATANTVNDNQNATPQEVQQATEALNNAIAAKERQDALDELQKALDAANAVKKDDYKPSTVTPFETAVQAGEAAKADTSKTPQELKEAAKAIKDAQDALQAKANKAELEKSIATAEGLGQLDPADKEDKAVQDALNKAKEVQADPNASQDAVDAAKKALVDAINAKKAQDAKEAKAAADAKQAALDALKEELAKVAKIDKDNFTPHTVAPLTEKEDAGKAIVAAPENKTTKEIEDATQALKDAEAALQAKSDKAALQAAIDKANTLGQLDPTDKEDKALQDAVTAGEAVKADGNATPQQVQEATKAITDAIAAKERQDALDALQKALDDAKTVKKDDYKPNTVAPFEAAITAGEAAKADATKTPEELKAAAKAITDAKNNLEAKANKDELNKAITTAEGLTLDPNDKEDKAVQDALAKAKEVQADQNATQAAVDAAKAALEDAINAKKAQDAKEAADAKQAALDALKQELAKAAQVDKNNYTPDSVKPLTDSQTAGQAIVDAPENKTTEEIEKATQALKDAQAGLVAKADKTELEKSIATAEGLGQLDPADKEDKAVQDALAAAKAVEQNPNATQTEVDNAKAALDEAINAKKAQDEKEAKAADAKQAALDALKAELEKAKAINKDEYTPDSVKPLTDAQTAGQAIVDAPDNKTTAEIEAATQALKDAQKDLVQKADKAELQKAIDKANTLGNLDANDPEDKAVQDKLADAERVKADDNATPQQVAEATKALNDAIAAKEHQDALDELNKAIDAANAVNKDDYKPNTVKPLEDAVKAGEAAKADATKTPQELKDAAKAITDAQKVLEAKANKDELNKAITTAEGLTLDPNDKEDKAVQEALNKAKEVQADPNASQADVDAAKEALENAVNAKNAQDAKEAQAAAKAKQEALDALKAELEKVAKINKDNFTPNTVAPLTEKEEAGKAIVANPDAKTTEEIKEATQALIDAENALQAKSDKVALQAAIDKANALGELNPADAEDKAIQDAVAAGEKVKADGNATPQEVADATKAINDAIAAKEHQDALDELNKAIDAAKAVNKDDFKPNTVKPLEDAVKAGETAKADATKTPQELKDAAKAITDAQKALEAKADKDELNKVITTAEGLTLDPADKEDKAVQDALAKAKEVQADPNASQDAVDAAKAALEDAINAKNAQDVKEAKEAADAKQAALDALKAELEKAKAINKDDYTPNSVEPLTDAETTGQAIVDAPDNKTTAEIEAATQALKDAQAGLVAKADKTELDKAITTADGLTLNPADKEDKAVQDALEKAKEVQANPNATQDEVNAAKDALNKAIEAKTAQDQADAKQAALDELKAELAKVAKIDLNQYTPDSVKPLTDKEIEGNAIVAIPDAKTTEEIKAVTQALKDAQAGLVQKADKAELQKAIDAANALGNLDAADKEDKALQDAVAVGEKVKADGNATPQQVADATKAINDAIAAKEHQDALDELNKAIEDAKAVNKDDFKPNTVKPLEDAIKAGETAKADVTKTPEELKEAAKAINDAKNNLEAKANKDELNKAITEAEGLTLDPKDKEDKAVQDALDKAKAVLEDPNATQEAVDAAKDALNKVVEAKKAQDAKEAAEKQAALDALKAELEKAKSVDKDAYTPNSVKPLTDAVTVGQVIVDAPKDKTVEEIKEATQALIDAQAGLVAKADKAELDKAINNAEGLTLDPTDKEDKAVQDALDKAIAVQADPNASQDAVDAAKDALNKAIEAKTAQDKADAVNAALEALKDELEKAKAINQADFTPNSVEPLVDAMAVAQGIVNNPESVTVDQIKEAIQTLKDAQAGLVAKADKTELDKAINNAEGLTLNPKDKENKAVQEALDKAKAVQVDANATQAEVDAAKDALNKAIEAKTAQDKADAVNAALEALKAELEKAKAINQADFTPNSVEPLVDTMAVAQGIVNNPESVNVDQIKAATQALKDAQAGLVAKADKTELDKAINNAESLTLDPADKEDKAVQDALDKAKSVRADANATQAEVDAAKSALEDAINAKTAQDKADAVNAALEALKAELEKAKAINKDDYTPNSVKPLVDAMAVAQGIVNNPESVTVDQIKEATQALKDAQAGLIAKSDKAELEKAINNAEGLTLDPTDKEDKAVQEALEKAKAVQADANATQTEVDAAKDALNKAVEAKATQDKADALAELQKALDKAQSTDKTKYTPESVEKLDVSVNTGKAIVENSKEVSIKDIQETTKAIEDALKALEVIKAPKIEKETDKVKSTSGKSVERTSDKAVKKSEGSKAQTKANKAKVYYQTQVKKLQQILNMLH
ncbi:putative Ig domain-containing protein [Staphylococcus simulans]|uniref:lectin-like domain-containing protein n=1 Tax=Staphylococcus simulans TaxID=1286 RepID=UPI0021CFD3CD|nr:putative Ig domain-containing protein [Staphylococcus simulans]UXR52025.1 putative Ig domain-containing protein [Staphylococcus simulans]